MDETQGVAVKFRADLVPGKMPLLLSHQFLSERGCVLGSPLKKMKVNDTWITLKLSESGHLFVKIGKWIGKRKRGHASAIADSQTARMVAIGEVTTAQMHKLHCQLGHDGVGRWPSCFARLDTLNWMKK